MAAGESVAVIAATNKETATTTRETATTKAEETANVAASPKTTPGHNKTVWSPFY